VKHISISTVSLSYDEPISKDRNEEIDVQEAACWVEPFPCTSPPQSYSYLDRTEQSSPSQPSSAPFGTPRQLPSSTRATREDDSLDDAEDGDVGRLDPGGHGVSPERVGDEAVVPLEGHLVVGDHNPRDVW
jgi:hypothetical protein